MRMLIQQELKTLKICLEALDELTEPEPRRRILNYLQEYVKNENKRLVADSIERFEKAEEKLTKSVKNLKESKLNYETMREKILSEYNNKNKDLSFDKTTKTTD